jgi:CMP-N-acetylneuraminic acid synthetase
MPPSLPMKVVAYVPLKLNNERLPGKNTKRFDNGEPLLTYIFSSLLGAQCVDEIYAYCSDDSIVDLLPRGVRYLSRSTGLDQSSTKINEVMSSFAAAVEADVYVLAHATAPFLSAASIRKGVQAVTSGEHDSALSVVELREFLWRDGAPMNYEPSSIPRTQDLAPLHAETTGLYIYTRELIERHGRRVGTRPFLIPVSKIEAIDINEPIDFVIANAVFNTSLAK